MLDVKSDCYRRTVRQLEETFGYRSSSGKADITPQKDFIKLHRVTKDFYATYFAEVFTNYVPLYHSLWKLRLKT
jgi:hypothetical protein